MRPPGGAELPRQAPDFNPRTPRGVRLSNLDTFFACNYNFNPRTPRGVRLASGVVRSKYQLFQSTHPARGATGLPCALCESGKVFQSTHPARGATTSNEHLVRILFYFNPRTPRGVRLQGSILSPRPPWEISIHAPREGCDCLCRRLTSTITISIHAPREGCDPSSPGSSRWSFDFNPRTPRGVRPLPVRLATPRPDFNPRTPRGVRQQTLPKSREFAWLNLLICTRGRRLSIRKQTRLCSMKLSFMLFGCEPAGEGVSSWTSHATKSKVRLEGRSAYSQSVRSSAHSDFPGNKSGGCPVRDP